MTALAIITRYWRIGLLAVLLLVIGVQTWRVSSLKADVRTEQLATAAERAAKDTTLASLKRLTAATEELAAVTNDLAAKDAARVMASKAAIAAADKASAARQVQIDRLRASAGVARAQGDCVVSDAVRESWR